MEEASCPTCSGFPAFGSTVSGGSPSGAQAWSCKTATTLHVLVSSSTVGKTTVSVRPSSRSFMAEVNLSTGPQLIGQDRLVELQLLQPGVAIGLWKVKTIPHRCRPSSFRWILHVFSSLCRTSVPLLSSRSPFTSISWWKEVSRDHRFGRLHMARNLSCMRSRGVQRITFHLLRLRDPTDATDVTLGPAQHGGI